MMPMRVMMQMMKSVGENIHLFYIYNIPDRLLQIAR